MAMVQRLSFALVLIFASTARWPGLGGGAGLRGAQAANNQPEPTAAIATAPNTYGKPDWARRPRFMDLNTYVLSAQTLQLELRTAPDLNVHDVAQSAWRSEARMRLGLGWHTDLLVQAHSLQPTMVGPTRLDGESLAVNWAAADWGLPTNPTLSLLWDRRHQDAPRLGGRLSLVQGFGYHVTTALNLTFHRAVLGFAQAQTYTLAGGVGLSGFGARNWPMGPAIEAAITVSDRAGSRLRADTRQWSLGPSVIWRVSDMVQAMASVVYVSRATTESAVLLHRQAIQPTLRIVFQPGNKAAAPSPAALSVPPTILTPAATL